MKRDDVARLCEPFRFTNDVFTDGDMGLDRLELGCAQLSRLEQKAVADTDLAHIVQEGAGALAASKVRGTGLNQAQSDAYKMVNDLIFVASGNLAFG